MSKESYLTNSAAFDLYLYFYEVCFNVCRFKFIQEQLCRVGQLQEGLQAVSQSPGLCQNLLKSFSQNLLEQVANLAFPKILISRIGLHSAHESKTICLKLFPMFGTSWICLPYQVLSHFVKWGIPGKNTKNAAQKR